MLHDRRDGDLLISQKGGDLLGFYLFLTHEISPLLLLGLLCFVDKKQKKKRKRRAAENRKKRGKRKKRKTALGWFRFFATGFGISQIYGDPTVSFS